MRRATFAPIVPALALLALPASVASAGADCVVYGTFAQQIDDLAWPTSVAVAPDGSFAVLERDAARIRLFAADGTEKGRIDAAASAPATDAPWHLALASGEPTPSTLAYTADGRLTIVTPSRVAIFDPSGTPWRVVTGLALRDPVAAAWRPVTEGAPEELWILDRADRRVVRLGAALETLPPLPLTEEAPSGLAFAADGTFFVADEERDRITRRTADGRELARFGDRGAFPGLFNSPSALVVRGECLYVTDTLNHRITIHDLDGTFRSYWGMHAVIPRQGEGKIHYPAALALTPDGGSAIVVEPIERRLQRFTRSNPNEAMNATMPAREGVQSHFGGPVACDGELLVLEEPESSSVFVFDLRDPTPIHVTTFGGSGEGPDRCSRISAVDIDATTQMLLVADVGSDRLSQFHIARDPTAPLKIDPFMATLVRSWELAAWTKRVEALAPAGSLSRADPARPVELVAFARTAGGPSGARVLWALDRRDGLLIAIDQDLQPTAVLATGLRGASGLSIASDGTFLTTLPDKGEVVRVDGQGAVVARHRGPEGMPLGRPNDVDVAADGSLWITDAARDELVVLASDGTLLQRIGNRGESDGELWAPEGIAAFTGATGASDGPRVIVVDRGNHRAQLFRADGSWLMTFGLGRAYTRPRERGET